MALELARITEARLKALKPDRTVFFFSTGALEDHGPHLPMGLDLLEAERVAILVAERIERELPDWTVVLMPRAPLAVDSATSATALRVRPHVLRDWLVDHCVGLNRMGFRYFACFSGCPSPKQLTAIEEVSRHARLRSGATWLRKITRPSQAFPIIVSANSAVVEAKTVFASPLMPDPREHGGERDTSIALALARESVEASYVALPPCERPDSAFHRWMDYWFKRRSGYWGDPAAGTAERGEVLLREEADRIFPHLRALLEGRVTMNQFKTWYSAFPPNWSFFHGWMLFIGIVLLMAAWIMLSF